MNRAATAALELITLRRITRYEKLIVLDDGKPGASKIVADVTIY